MKRGIVVLLLLALFLVGCGGKQKQEVASAFIGGDAGVNVQFEELSVVEGGVFTIFDSEDFPLAVLVRNLGEQEVAPGEVRLRLLGPAREDFRGISSWDLQNTETIEKISEFNPEGGEEIVSFTPNSFATYEDEVTGFTDINWNLETTYDYKTHLIVNDVCFKTDLTDDKVCTVQQTRTFSVSGAPVQVTAVSEDSGGKGIVVLKITVQDQSTGRATVLGREFDNRFDQIGYSVDEPDRWECKSGGRQNEARLIEGQAQIICRLKNPLVEDDIFTKPVRLTLEYTYQTLIQEKLRIKESVR